MRSNARLRGFLCAVGAALAVAPSANAASPPLKAATAPAAQLELSATIPAPGGEIYRYQQEAGGVPVLGAVAVVQDPPGQAPTLVTDATEPGVETPAPAVVGRADAIATATGAVGLRRLMPDSRPSATLGIDANRGDGALVWTVAVPALDPLGDFRVTVDARSGRVLAKSDVLRFFRTGSAKVFVPNPVVDNGGDAGLHDNGDSNSPLLTSLREPVVVKRLSRGQHCLRGRWVEARIHNNARKVCKRNLNWDLVRRASDKFEALMAYFHIDQTQAYIHRLGFDNVNARRQQVLADFTMPPSLGQDNSFYSPSTRRIQYGYGGVDDAEDADVIVHEYGHAIQDAQAPGFGRGSEAGAIGEGFGDYLAAAMSAQNGGTTTDNVCIFDWDGTVWGSDAGPDGRVCGRLANDDRTFAVAELQCAGPFDPAGEIHCVGQVWSSALYDLREAVGGAVMDRDVLRSQFFYADNEKFRDAAAHLVDADQGLFGGAHVAAICNEMEGDRGLNVPGCP